MIQRKIQCISMNDEIIGMLEWVSKETQMTKSAVVQELIRKAFNDPKTMEIIQLENLKRELNKKKGGTSCNVHCVNSKENGSEGPYQADPGCPAKGTFTIVGGKQYTMQECIEIAKFDWRKYCEDN